MPDSQKQDLHVRLQRIENVLLYVPLITAVVALVLSLVLPSWSVDRAQRPDSTTWLLTAPIELLATAHGRHSIWAWYAVGIVALLIAVGLTLWFLGAASTRSVGRTLRIVGRVATGLLLAGSILLLVLVVADAATDATFRPGVAVALLPLGAACAAVVAFGLRWLWTSE